MAVNSVSFLFTVFLVVSPETRRYIAVLDFLLLNQQAYSHAFLPN